MKETNHILLDDTDRRILVALQEDGARSAADVAEILNLTATTCWRRITQLEKQGVIRRRVALLDRGAIGLNVMVFAHVKLSSQGRDVLARFEHAIRDCPEVIGCYTIMGDWDFLLHIVARDIRHYESFYLDHLSKMPTVESVSSAMVMTVIKETTELPVPKGR
ncbi:MAG: Lrp/AsnC family transcriptional regulator [Steroidobacteraceae bacterium]